MTEVTGPKLFKYKLLTSSGVDMADGQTNWLTERTDEQR